MRYLRRFLIALGVVLGILLAWGLIEPYFLDVEEEEALIPGLPDAWVGQRVAVIADWQLGMWLANERTVRRAVERVVQERPAFALILGDFTYHAHETPEEQLEEITGLIRPLVESGIPAYAVLGNHDYGLSHPDGSVNPGLARSVETLLERAGIQVLHNEAVPLPLPGASNSTAPVYVAGIGSEWAEEAAPERAVAGIPSGAARVVLMHNPDSFAGLPAGTAPLAVAGHTHGGQVRIPLLPQWSWLTFAKSDEIHADGWITGYGASGNRLYVNRGIGFSALPLRINCVPELTLFRLTRAD